MKDLIAMLSLSRYNYHLHKARKRRRRIKNLLAKFPKRNGRNRAESIRDSIDHDLNVKDESSD
ncbi:hypothetical protein ACT7DH_06735 [Bacillus pacificus]